MEPGKRTMKLHKGTGADGGVRGKRIFFKLIVSAKEVGAEKLFGFDVAREPVGQRGPMAAN